MDAFSVPLQRALRTGWINAAIVTWTSLLLLWTRKAHPAFGVAVYSGQSLQSLPSPCQPVQNPDPRICWSCSSSWRHLGWPKHIPKSYSLCTMALGWQSAQGSSQAEKAVGGLRHAPHMSSNGVPSPDGAVQVQLTFGEPSTGCAPCNGSTSPWQGSLLRSDGTRNCMAKSFLRKIPFNQLTGCSGTSTSPILFSPFLCLCEAMWQWGLSLVCIQVSLAHSTAMTVMLLLLRADWRRFLASLPGP